MKPTQKSNRRALSAASKKRTSIRNERSLQPKKTGVRNSRSVQSKKTGSRTKRSAHPQKIGNQNKAALKSKHKRGKPLSKGTNKRQPSTIFQKLRQFIKEIMLALLIFSFVVVMIQQFTFEIPKMEGYSMLPTMNNGDRLWVNKWGKLKRFTIVYYRDPETKETSFRRIIGLPGEQLTYKEDQLLINGYEQVERFLEDEKAQAKEKGTTVTEDFELLSLIGKEVLAEGEYFVLGDHRSYASDSRTFGTIKEADIIGVVAYRLLPFHEIRRF